jgi:hypothetical protein
MICERIPASSVAPATSLPWPRMRLAPPPLAPARRAALPPAFTLPAASMPPAPPDSLFAQRTPPEEQDAERWDGLA